MPRGIASNGQRARRRTKAEMQAAKASTTPVKSSKTKTTKTTTKRHRRTKAEMQAFRASLVETVVVPVVKIMEPTKPVVAPAPKPTKTVSKATMSSSDRETAGRDLHAKSLLSFLPWSELSRGSREEFCAEAEKNACNTD